MFFLLSSTCFLVWVAEYPVPGGSLAGSQEVLLLKRWPPSPTTAPVLCSRRQLYSFKRPSSLRQYMLVMTDGVHFFFNKSVMLSNSFVFYSPQSVMVSFMCQWSRLQFPVIQSNTNPHVAMTVFCRCN